MFLRRRRRAPPSADRRPGADERASRTCTTSPGSSPPSCAGDASPALLDTYEPERRSRWSATRSARSRTPSTTSAIVDLRSASRTSRRRRRTCASAAAHLERAARGRRAPRGGAARDPAAVDGVQRAQRRVRLHVRVRGDRPRRQPRRPSNPDEIRDLPAVDPAGRAAPPRVDRRRGRRPPADQGPRRARPLPADRRRGRRAPGARPRASWPRRPACRSTRSGSATSTATSSTRAACGPRHREIGTEGAILVRPDRFVAWRNAGAVEQPLDELSEALGRILGKPVGRPGSGRLSHLHTGR